MNSQMEGSFDFLEGRVVVVLGGVFSGYECSVCEKSAEYGIATRNGPQGCIEAIRSGEVYCREHSPCNEENQL